MAVLNQANVRKVRTHLATMAGVLKSVASGDSEGALQTLESIVGGDDNEQFEDLLDSQETLAHLVTLAESSLDEDEEEDEESDDSDEEDEEDEESEDEEDVATASVKTGSPKHKRIMKERAAFLGIAQAGFDEDDEDEDDEEDDSEDDEDFEDDEADSETDDDSEDDSEESEEDEESEDDEEEEDEATAKVTARFKKNLAGRKKAQASVSKPKVAQKASKANANPDGRL